MCDRRHLAKGKEKLPVLPLTLVGRCFHTFDSEGSVQYQGIVRADLGNGNYLVQYFEWLAGEANTMSIVHISKMLEPEQPRRNGWQFYEDCEHMTFWYEHRYVKSRPERVA